ncbi:MAG: protein-export chaperone SecB [Stenotrophobium sp.]
MADSDDKPVQRQALLQKIYLKDASLEVPLAPQIFTRSWQPQLDVQVNTEVKNLGESNWQVLLSVTVTAKLDADVAFLAEVQQAGVFTLSGFANDAELGPVLGAYCPNLLFPFARETVASLVQHGGFPQLLLQPINFDALYAEHQKSARAQQAGKVDGHAATDTRLN